MKAPCTASVALAVTFSTCSFTRSVAFGPDVLGGSGALAGFGAYEARRRADVREVRVPISDLPASLGGRAARFGHQGKLKDARSIQLPKRGREVKRLPTCISSFALSEAQ